jgi:tetratricopeptide (TPR) repeat protein
VTIKTAAPLRLAGFSVLALALACIIASSGQTAPLSADERAKAEKIFADVYGAEYQKLLKAPEVSPRIDYARKLLAAAEEVDPSDPAQALILREKAIPLAAAGPAGYSLAIDLLEKLLPDAPSRSEVLARLADVRDRQMRAAKAPTASIVIDLVNTLQDLAAEQAAERHFTAAHKTLDRARVQARERLGAAGKDLIGEIDGQIELITRRERIGPKVIEAEKVLQSKPADPEANTLVGLAKLVYENKAAQAATYLAKSSDQALINLAELINSRAGQVELADLYKAAGESTAAKDFKEALLARALNLYRAIEEDDPNNPDITRIKLLTGPLAEAAGAEAKYHLGRTRTAIFARIDEAMKRNRLRDTQRLGTGENAFRDLPTAPAHVVGFDVGYGEFFGSPVISAIRPIYQTPAGRTPGTAAGIAKQGTKPTRVEAKPGYAVGAISVRAGAGIDGFSVTFMQIEGDRLNPEKSYKSAWLGGRGGAPPRELGGDGAPVVGIFGRTNDENRVVGLGLVLADDKGSAPPRRKN